MVPVKHTVEGADSTEERGQDPGGASGPIQVKHSGIRLRGTQVHSRSGPPGTQFLNLADLAARRLRFAGRLPWLAFLTLRLFLLLM